MIRRHIGIAFVVVGVVDSLHEHFSVIDPVCQSTREQTADMRGIRNAFPHGRQILIFLSSDSSPRIFQSPLQHQVQPDPGAAPVSFHEGMRHIHLDVFADDLIQRRFRHVFDTAQDVRKISGIGEREAALADFPGPYLPGEAGPSLDLQPGLAHENERKRTEKKRKEKMNKRAMNKTSQAGNLK